MDCCVPGREGGDTWSGTEKVPRWLEKKNGKVDIFEEAGARVGGGKRWEIFPTKSYGT